VWGIGLSLGGTTGYAINPARDLGHDSRTPSCNSWQARLHWAYAWVPIFGPLVGAAIAAAFVHFFNVT